MTSPIDNPEPEQHRDSPSGSPSNFLTMPDLDVFNYDAEAPMEEDQRPVLQNQQADTHEQSQQPDTEEQSQQAESNSVLMCKLVTVHYS